MQMNLRAVAKWGCGYAFENEYMASHGNKKRSVGFVLPTTLQRSSRIISYSIVVGRKLMREHLLPGGKNLSCAWIDLGGGRPDRPPYRVAER
jgi:hypothetical protein